MMDSKEKISKKGGMQDMLNKKQRKNNKRNNINSTCDYDHSFDIISNDNNSSINRAKWIIKQISRSKNSE